MDPVRHIAFTNELGFERPRDEVFEAFLDTGKWFQISYGQERLTSVVNDRRVGGQIYEDWGDGTGKLHGTIGWWDPPEGYSTVSQMLGGGITLNDRNEFAQDGGATVLRHVQRVRPDLRRDGRRNRGGTRRSRTSSRSSARGSSAAR
jgi:hypothetical protein